MWSRVARGVAWIVYLVLLSGCGARGDGKPSDDPGDKKVTPDGQISVAQGDGDQELVGKKKASADLKELQGTWKCVLRTIGEKELFPSQGKQTLEISGDKCGEGTLILDAAAKPKSLDIKLSVGDDKGKTMKGIYEFREGKLVWCFNNDVNGPRPASFDPAKHSDSMEVCVFESTEVEKLQGHWHCVLRTIGEKELYPSQGKKNLEISRRRCGEGTLTIDAMATPKRLDIQLMVGADQGKTMKGIYEFRDDQLVWCFNNDVDGPRPDSFDPATHSETIEVCVFVRNGRE